MNYLRRVENAEHKAALHFFSGRAEAFLANSANPEERILGTAYRAHIDRTLPLEIAWDAPPHVITRDEKHFVEIIEEKISGASHIPDSFERHRHLCEVLSRIGPAPTTWNGRAMVSAREMHDRMILKPSYYVKRAEDDIINSRIRDYADDIDGKVVIALCTSSGSKDLGIMSRARDMGAFPKKVYLNDISTSAVDDGVSLFQAERFRCAPLAGDILTDEFWVQPLWQELRDAKKPVVVFLHGATLNDFTSQQRVFLYRKLQENLPPGSIYRLALDSTLAPDILKQAYFYPEVEQWLVRAEVHKFSMVGLFDLDLWSLGCKLDISKKGPNVVLQHMVTHSYEQSVRVMVPKPHKARKLLNYSQGMRFRVQAGDVRCGAITKIAEKVIETEFHKGGLTITDRHIARPNIVISTKPYTVVPANNHAIYRCAA